MERLAVKDVKLIIYESQLDSIDIYHDFQINNDLELFKSKSTVIIANRYDACLDDMKEKVYSRDVFHNN